MKIHEYQAKELLAKHGVPVLRGRLAHDADGAAKAFEELAATAAKAGGSFVAVVKAQVHAGGRGKAGGVKLVKSAAEAKSAAAGMFAKPLVTHQTGPAGAPGAQGLGRGGATSGASSTSALVAARSFPRKPVVMASAEGGVEIEEVAARSPDKILREWFDPLLGLCGYQARRLALQLELRGDAFKAAVRCTNACRAFVESDASMVEINPLVVLKSGGMVALDAKVAFDGNALWRHKDVAVARQGRGGPARARRERRDLSWVSLDGDVGCMVNGAGLAMATMDAIKLAGGFPALPRRRRRHQGAGLRRLQADPRRPEGARSS